MKKTVFTSKDLPSHLNENAKFSLWQEIHNDQIWSVEYSKARERPFEADIEALPIGNLVIGHMAGAIKQADRTNLHIANDGRDGHLLLVNLGVNPLNGLQIGREYSLAHGEAALVSASEPLTMTGGDWNIWSNLVIPSHILRAAFGDIDNKLGITIDAGSEPLRLLQGYSRLLEDGAPLQSPDLIEHAATTLLDLVGLATGTKGEVAELAGMRGLRAARLQAVLGQIDRRFTEVGLSTRDIAVVLGISTRYVNDILHESGLGFSDRVLELRLQRARAMLSDRRNDGMRVSDIAYASGFADISHFNRSFRRRFGLTPTGAR